MEKPIILVKEVAIKKPGRVKLTKCPAIISETADNRYFNTETTTIEAARKLTFFSSSIDHDFSYSLLLDTISCIYALSSLSILNSFTIYLFALYIYIYIYGT